jgi:hypothetical protein
MRATKSPGAESGCGPASRPEEGPKGIALAADSTVALLRADLDKGSAAADAQGKG